MPYNEKAAERLRGVLAGVDQVSERRMMGSLIFMVKDHMCCGITGDSLMVRIGPDAHAAALNEPNVGPMDIGGGRQPRAFICVAPAGFRTRASLEKWVQRGIAFVDTLPEKKTSKKRAVKKSVSKKRVSKKASSQKAAR